MEVKTYRASSMQEALVLVRSDLGPNASVLHTREVHSRRLFGLLSGRRHIEVTASCDVNVPSRLPRRTATSSKSPTSTMSKSPDYCAVDHGLRSRLGKSNVIDACESSDTATTIPIHKCQAPVGCPDITTDVQISNSQPQDRFQNQLNDLNRMVQDLCRQSHQGGQRDLPDSLFHIFTDLIEADVDEQLARTLVEQIRTEIPNAELADPLMVQARVARLIESQIRVSGPIAVAPGQRRLVALVGPTGVGKTTTIAKLAANYHLKKRQSVGLITVDTYRIAAVEQLRTYADIIDLPMQVVSTPREMREAVHRLSGLDLILMDTAGRSPRDEIKIQELKAFLNEAEADEVHLVLSSCAGSRALQQTARQFAAVGTTSLILTKLDESTALGNLLGLLRHDGLPLSYLTNGQNVPDDIETADAGRLAKLILAGEPAMI